MVKGKITNYCIATMLLVASMSLSACGKVEFDTRDEQDYDEEYDAELASLDAEIKEIEDEISKDALEFEKEEKEEEERASKEIEEKEELEEEQYRSASIVYMNGHKLDLASWNEKDINTVIDEIASTGIYFNKIDGARNLDKDGIVVSKEDVKKAIEVTQGDRIIIGFNNGDEKSALDAELTLDTSGGSYHTLILNINSIYSPNLITLGETGKTIKDIGDLDLKGAEQFIKDSGMFTKASEDEYGVNMEALSHKYFSAVKLNHMTTYEFAIYDYNENKTGKSLYENKAYENEEDAFNKEKNRLCVINYNNRAFNFAEILDMSVEESIDKLNDFGFEIVGVEVENYTKSADAEDRKVNILTQGDKHIADVINDALKNEELKKCAISYIAHLNTTQDENGEGWLSVQVYKEDGKVARTYVKFVRPTFYDYEEQITYTTDKLKIARTNKRTDDYDKLVENLNMLNENKYQLEYGNDEIYVTGISDLYSVDGIGIKRVYE